MYHRASCLNWKNLFRMHWKPRTIMGTYFSYRQPHLLYGPDQLVPSLNQYTEKPDGSVKLARTKGPTDWPSISVPGFLHLTATRFPNNVALSYMDPKGQFKHINFMEYEELVRICAKAFIKLGLERYHSVCILGLNSPEWIIADLGAAYAGGFGVGIYTTNSPEVCLHCANLSRANIIVVQDPEYLNKILTIKDRLKYLKVIVQYEGIPTEPDVLSWEQLLKIGQEQSNKDLDHILTSISSNECCKLVFTSGTSGEPKAVMLSHDNVTWTGRNAKLYVGLLPGQEVIVSYLPLSHVAAQAVDIYLPVASGARVFFADKNALKGTLIESLRHAKPTIFLGVPRVWEKLSEKIVSQTIGGSKLQRAIVKWARHVGLKHHMDIMNGKKEHSSIQYKLASKVVFSHIKKAAGLENCSLMYTGAAPLSLEVKRKCWSFDIRVVEGFGMSETTGCHIMNLRNSFRIDSIGRTLPGCFTKIDKPDTNNHGEILLKGRNICMGYLNDLPTTEESFTKDGWFCSGDLGFVDSQGFVHITGRKKELIITAGGENVAPLLIEDNIIKELKCIHYAIVVGDKRKYITVLLTLKTEVNDQTGDPTDELSVVAKNWCQRKGSESTTITEIITTRDEKVYNAIQAGIERANEQSISRPSRVQKFAILPHDFSIKTGELGPTLKVRRKVVLSMYADVIESLYKE